MEETLRDERRATSLGIDTEDKCGWESTNSVMARCISKSGTRAWAVLVSVAASEVEGLAACGSVPGMFGMLEAKMVEEVAVVEVEGAVAALEAIERSAGSSLSLAMISNLVVEAHLLVYLP
jgi:hypothetical protein